MARRSLGDLWHASAPGRLTAWQQAYALALREASKEVHVGHVYVTWIAAKLRKTDATGHAYSHEAPGPSAVTQLFQK
eukprot:9004024-Lingulodinium_polyedra.AAC.1